MMKFNRNSNYNNIFTGALAMATLAVIAYSLFISATVYSNVIIGRDEANFILKSTLQLLSARNWQEWINALFQTHGQHVLVGMQLGNLFSYYTTGYINFQLINILGLLYLIIPCCLIVYKKRPGLTEYIILSAMVFPLALSPGHNSCAINVACTGNHYLGLGLAIVALYFFTETTRCINLLLAEIFLALAVFSSPAALVVIALAFPVLWLVSEKNKRVLLAHLLSSLLILVIYYWAVSRNLSEATIIEAETHWLRNLLLMALTFFRIVGSFAYWSEGAISGIFSILLGLFICITGLVYVYKISSKHQRSHAIIFYASGFVMMLAMIALISLGRFYELGSTRYVFYSCFAIIFLLLLILENASEKTKSYGKIVAVIILLYYPLQFAFNKPYLDRIQWQITACEAQWRENQLACGAMIKHEEATALLREAQDKGILPQQLLIK